VKRQPSLPADDPEKLSARLDGKTFEPSHYIGAFGYEVADDPEAQARVKIDEEARTISYDGTSGYWGVKLTFTSSDAGLVLTKIDTWDVEP
jgi:hypothetical protein